MLCPTPPEKLCDAKGRPHFLWDNNLTLEQLKERLASPDPAIRAYWIAVTMRQARPDDALSLIPIAEMRTHWPTITRHLGRERAFWAWYLDRMPA